jgi:hypothetical protein
MMHLWYKMAQKVAFPYRAISSTPATYASAVSLSWHDVIRKGSATWRPIDWWTSQVCQSTGQVAHAAERPSTGCMHGIVVSIHTGSPVTNETPRFKRSTFTVSACLGK